MRLNKIITGAINEVLNEKKQRKLLKETGFIDRFRRTENANYLPDRYRYSSDEDTIYYIDEDGKKHNTGIGYGKGNVGQNWNPFSRDKWDKTRVSKEDNERVRKKLMRFDKRERVQIDNAIKQQKMQERARRLQQYREHPNMARAISVPRKAEGSWDDRLGQDTLLYTPGVTDELRTFGSSFQLSNKSLSKKAASMVWVYSPKHKVYRLMHVQGSSISSPSLARDYNFVGTYEIPEDEMEMIDNSLSSLMSSIPRAKQLSAGSRRGHEREDTTLNVNVKKLEELKEDGINLKDTIENALRSGRRLLVKMRPTNANLFNDGIFECEEFNLLVSVIDHIDPRLRTSATFAFCADDQYENTIKEYGIKLIFYPENVKIKPSGGDVNITWEDAVSGNLYGKIIDEEIRRFMTNAQWNTRF